MIFVNFGILFCVWILNGSQFSHEINQARLQRAPRGARGRFSTSGTVLVDSASYEDAAFKMLKGIKQRGLARGRNQKRKYPENVNGPTDAAERQEKADYLYLYRFPTVVEGWGIENGPAHKIYDEIALWKPMDPRKDEVKKREQYMKRLGEIKARCISREKKGQNKYPRRLDGTLEAKDAMYLWKACPFPEAQELYDEILSWKIDRSTKKPIRTGQAGPSSSSDQSISTQATATGRRSRRQKSPQEEEAGPSGTSDNPETQQELRSSKRLRKEKGINDEPVHQLQEESSSDSKRRGKRRAQNEIARPETNDIPPSKKGKDPVVPRRITTRSTSYGEEHNAGPSEIIEPSQQLLQPTNHHTRSSRRKAQSEASSSGMNEMIQQQARHLPPIIDSEGEMTAHGMSLTARTDLAGDELMDWSGDDLFPSSPRKVNLSRHSKRTNEPLIFIGLILLAIFFFCYKLSSDYSVKTKELHIEFLT